MHFKILYLYYYLRKHFFFLFAMKGVLFVYESTFLLINNTINNITASTYGGEIFKLKKLLTYIFLGILFLIKTSSGRSINNNITNSAAFEGGNFFQKNLFLLKKKVFFMLKHFAI